MDLASADKIERRIYFIRGHKVMLDRDLADLYGVATGSLNRAVKRNKDRFPPDFMFQLDKAEWAILKCQFGISSWGGDRGAHYAFTEQGVAMLSSVLNSKRAAQVNVAIMRAFVKLRQALSSHEDLAKRLNEVERRVLGVEASHGEQAKQVRAVFRAIRKLMEPPEEPPSPPEREIGFKP